MLEKQEQLTAEDAVVLGDNLRMSGRLDEAATSLEQTARENPSFVQPLLSLGEVRIQQQQFDQADDAVRARADDGPRSDRSRPPAGRSGAAPRRPRAAETQYGRILALDPSDVEATTKLGVLRMRAGRQRRGAVAVHESDRARSGEAEALLYMAGVLTSSGRPADALPYFERSIKANPTTMALNGMGITLLALGERQRAADAFRQSLRLDPKQPDVAAAAGCNCDADRVERSKRQRVEEAFSNLEPGARTL